MLRSVVFIGLLFVQSCAGFLGSSVRHQPSGAGVIQSSSFAGKRSFSTSTLFSSSSTTNQDVSLDDLRSKPVKELKKALQDRRIPSNDLLEKEELVQRLYQALQNNHNPPPLETTTEAPKDTSYATSSTSSNDNVIVAPLQLTALRDNVRVDNLGGHARFQPTDQPFATMDLIILQSQPGGNTRQLTLMVDTACSGVVLHSRAISQYNLPQLSTPVTSMGASGSAEATGLTEIPPFRVSEQQSKVFSKLPAAVQDLDTLPVHIDGILGLSFLGQFHAVDFDYTTNQLYLYETAQAAEAALKEHPSLSSSKVVARGPLQMLGSLGVYTVNVYLGGRGPVKMIVDTGGSNTFLSWKGVSDLGLDKTSKALSRIPMPMGAMGSTAQVFELTHRIHVSSQLQLGSKSSNDGLSLAADNRLPIDIGDIPLLQMMASQGAGGILGLDVFSRCKAIRLTLKGNKRELLLLA